MHRIEIDVGAVAPDDEHRSRNFVEAVWVSAHERGWVDNLDFIDRRSNEMWAFSFDFPARDSHRAVSMVETLVGQHMMSGVAVRHLKKVKTDG